MIQKLKECGISSSCVELGLFDYLVRSVNASQRSYSYDVVFAGNLAKSAFLNKLSQNFYGTKLHFNVYGIGRDSLCNSDIVSYKGVFSADDPSCVQGSWGLVWDGPSAQTLTGTDGNYQRYNSPHKASMYLAAGLPLIAFSGSAVALYVRQSHIGIVVDSLYNLEEAIASVTEERYEEMRQNVMSFSEKITQGQNLMQCISIIIEDNIHKNGNS